MSIKLNSIQTEEYLKEYNLVMNDMVKTLIKKNELPYITNAVSFGIKNIISGIEYLDLNKFFFELNQADNHYTSSLIISSSEANNLGLVLKNTENKTFPCFGWLKKDGKEYLEVEMYHFVEQFEEQSINKVLKKCFQKKMNNKKIAKGFVTNKITNGIKNQYLQQVIKDNLKNENIKKINNFKRNYEQLDEQKIVFDYLCTYYLNQRIGAKIVSTNIDKKLFINSALKLAEFGLFSKTSFNANLISVRMCDKDLCLNLDKRITLPTVTKIREFESISKELQQSKVNSLEK